MSRQHTTSDKQIMGGKILQHNFLSSALIYSCSYVAWIFFRVIALCIFWALKLVIKISRNIL